MGYNKAVVYLIIAALENKTQIRNIITSMDHEFISTHI